MSCLADERFVQILDLGGLDATRSEEREHLESCDTCRESWATVSAAAEALTESRPRREERLVWFPLSAAAAVLLVIVGIILLKTAPAVSPKPVDSISRFMEGKPEEWAEARGSLLKKGRAGLLPLVEARIRYKGSPRVGALRDLIHEIKGAGQDAFRAIEEHKVSVKLSRIELKSAISLIRGPSGTNILFDPTLPEAVTNTMVDLDVVDGTMRGVLELLCTVSDLDFDHRYGVWFLSTPAKLWAAPGAPPVRLDNSWQRTPLAPENAPVADKLRSVTVTLDAQGAPLDTLLEYVFQISSVRVMKTPGLPDLEIDLKVEGLALSHFLELLTLPRGLDVHLESGAIVIFAPKR